MSDHEHAAYSTRSAVLALLEYEEETHIDYLPENECIQAIPHDTLVEKASVLLVVYSPVQSSKLW